MPNTTATEIRAHYGQPDPKVYAKQLPRLDRHARAFIELSPFLVIASADASGHCDATPRGDQPGFVAIIDDATLAIPDRIGNRRVDTFLNVAANPHIGLVFMVPGINETLRVNGSALISRNAELLEAMAVQGKQPLAALIVQIEEVFFHCGKALMRSDLWNPEKKLPRANFPSLGRILADQISQGQGAEESEKWIAESYSKRLY